ncbi:MAG: DNA polymerase IV [Deltaproteobacteria bacterium]|nr:DNA polymerase IV [Deltaproteobacteria bacterium]
MILHVDMDAFFASVEKLDNPELLGRCVIVGGQTARGVVAAASYEARAKGVRSAMPMYRARRLCPDGAFLPPRKSRYSQVSERAMAVLRLFSPLVEQVSIDEAYLDISGCERLFGPSVDVGNRIKQKIKADIGITCSVGIAPVKFLAKIASAMNKPDGLTIIGEYDVPGFIDSLFVEKVPGVGPAARSALLKIGITRLGDIRKFPEDILVKQLGKFGRKLYALALGNDPSAVCPVRSVKSISHEATLESDTKDISLLRGFLLKQAEAVGRALRRENADASTVFIKVKHSDFSQASRQTALCPPTRASEEIFSAASRLLLAYEIKKPVRLIGVGVSGLDFIKKPRQMNLFPETGKGYKKWEKLDNTVDEILERFGDDAVKKGRLFDQDKEF